MDHIPVGVHELPNEVLGQVISYLDVEPPSLKALRREPSILMTCSDEQPLKALSHASQRMRSLALQSLFKYTRVHLSVPSHQEQGSLSGSYRTWPRLQIEAFISFLISYMLSAHVKGIVIYTELEFPAELCQGLKTRFFTLWRSLLKAIDPEFITICGPPSTTASLAGCYVRTMDAWAFDMPLHVLHLSRPRRSAGNVFHPAQASRVLDLFYLKPWTYCTLNEGSFLKAYSTYEYYSKRPPSIADSYGENMSILHSTGTSLTAFDYVAIFPFGTHIRHELGRHEIRGVLAFVESLPNLRRLRTQLAPDPESKILEDAARMQKTVPADTWMELDSGYTMITQSISRMEQTGQLKEFVSLDYAIQGLQQSLDEQFEQVLPGWARCGDGHWRKDKTLEVT
ncbi:hypothetical protein MMC24_002752 [Lignoscripta atroalba]|nr:hypothetical protein [Lignoscripta atroalba]